MDTILKKKIYILFKNKQTRNMNAFLKKVLEQDLKN